MIRRTPLLACLFLFCSSMAYATDVPRCWGNAGYRDGQYVVYVDAMKASKGTILNVLTRITQGSGSISFVRPMEFPIMLGIPETVKGFFLKLEAHDPESTPLPQEKLIEYVRQQLSLIIDLGGVTI